jgi:phosphoglucosamine mutase
LQLGGEQSGHIIIRKYATTGDALLTSIMLTEEMKDRKCAFSKLCDKLTLNPQICKNYIVDNKNAVVQDTALTEQINNINKNLSDGGRVILRASGTENLIRVMVETKSEEKCVSLIKQIEQLMKERNYLL